jgi:propanediol dehydratase small subunit
MSWPLLIVLLLALLFAVVLEVTERTRLRKFLDRPCAGIRWHRRFPTVPHNEIREFLSIFTAAFAFDEKHRGRFAPDDQLLAIYRARYVPHVSLDDFMEFESLTESLATHYGIDLPSVWRDDLTLGELFAITQKRSTE